MRQTPSSHPSSASSFPVVPFAVLGVLVVSGLLWSRWKAPPPFPVAIIVGLDASQSVRQPLPGGATQLGRSRAALARLGASLNTVTDYLVVTRVDRQVNEFYAQAAPEGYESFLRLLLNHSQKPASRPGTFPAKFWRRAAAQAADAQTVPGRAIAVVYYGDADNDDLTPSARAQIAAAARKLASNPRVFGVWVFGAKPENWDDLRTLFAPLRGRFHLAARDQLAPQPLLDQIDRVRRAQSARPSRLASTQ